jgi:hypothetical protein
MTEPVEKHDGGFMGPLVMFPTFPHNDTFVETREVQIHATPVNPKADMYTFIHNREDYGLMRTEDATISAKISIKNIADGGDPANDQVIVLNALPLRLGWKSKEVYVNNQQINSTSSKENELAWVNHLMTDVPSGYLPAKDINLCIHDTPGHFDSVAHVLDCAAGLNNKGARQRYQACNQGGELICLDQLDLLGITSVLYILHLILK